MISCEAFSALMAGLDLPEVPRRLAVAVSGGADSMALALLAKDWAAAHGVELTALTVNHGIRPEAAAEAEQVRSWLEGRGLPCIILTPATPITGSNIQEKARKARYGLMAEWCRSLHGFDPLPSVVPHAALGGSSPRRGEVRRGAEGAQVLHIKPPPHPSPCGGGSADTVKRCVRHDTGPPPEEGGDCRKHSSYLLVAHHADDQLETLLLRLVRAGGVEGLAGMRPVRRYQGMTLLRPLLSVSKARLITTLQARGQEWLEDPGNRSPAYTRNRLRPVAEMLAAEGLTAERVTLLTRQLANTAEYLAAEVGRWLDDHAERGEEGQACTPLVAWRDVPPEIGWRALRSLLQEVGGAEKPARSEKLLPLFTALAAGELHKPRTLGGCLIRPDARDGTVCFLREP